MRSRNILFMTADNRNKVNVLFVSMININALHIALIFVTIRKKYYRRSLVYFLSLFVFLTYRVKIAFSLILSNEAFIKKY